MTLLLLAQIVFGSPFLEAAVCPARGGELCSLKVKHKGEWVETLYSAETGWTGRAPWLWPATGKGAPLPFHGFARDLPWRVAAQAKDGVTVTLSDTPETRKMYPHAFRLAAEYKARGRELTIRFRVDADKANRAPMPFAAGNHITFRTPLAPGTAPGAMTLTTPSTVEYLKQDGAPTGERRARSLASPVALRDFDARVAVSLGGYADEPFMILRDPGGIAVKISHRASSAPAEPVVRFNMWGDPSQGYFSPEPWVGLQDAHRLGQGLVRLEPGQRWDWVLRIELVD